MKTLNTIISETNTKVYTNPAYYNVMRAKMNSAAAFTPILAPNGKVDGTTTKYTLQRLKRPKVATVADVNAGTFKSATDALDQFSVKDWETLDVATGVLRSVGFKETINDNFDISNSDYHMGEIKRITNEIAIARSKEFNTLLATAPKTGAALPAHVDGKTIVWDAIADETIKLAQVDDDFADVRPLNEFLIEVSMTVAKELAKENGTGFYNEAAIAQTGFKTNMQVNGSPVVINPRLTAREVIISHDDALAFHKQAIEKSVAIDMGLVSYTGTFFYDVMVIVDKARIKQFGA